MKYGTLTHNNKKYYCYNSNHMKGLTHGEYLETVNVEPKQGNDTPMKSKRNELGGFTVFIIEIK